MQEYTGKYRLEAGAVVTANHVLAGKTAVVTGGASGIVSRYRMQELLYIPRHLKPT